MSGQPSDFCLRVIDEGRARDYAVFFTREPPVDDAALEKQLDAHLGRCASLRQWAASHGTALTESASGVEALESLLTAAHSSPPMPWRLRVETGLFLGTVLVRTLPWARWRLLPNGHPVVRLAEQDVDIIALAAARLRTGSPDLTTVLPYAESLAPNP